MAAHLYDDYLRHFPPLPIPLIPYQPHHQSRRSCIDDNNNNNNKDNNNNEDDNNNEDNNKDNNNNNNNNEDNNDYDTESRIDVLYDDYFRRFPPLPSPLIPYRNQPHRSYIDDLNDTLLELIFTRLVQWRHLVTCKCVSKRWNSIISNPDFAHYLTKKYKYTPFTLILHVGWTDDSLIISEHPYFRTHKLHLNDFSPNNYPFYNYLVAYHNDILVWRDPFNSGGFAYKICNPLTEQFIVVPVTPNELDPYTYYGFHSNCKVGFAGVVNGVSTIDVPNSTNNVIGFRIILIDTEYYENNLIMQIYSSVTGEWKTYNVSDLGFEFRSYQAVTSNNRVHWHGRSNKILVIDPFSVDDIVSYCVINLPSEIYEDSVLGSCQNRLRLAQIKPDLVTPRIEVWEFDKHDELMNWEGNSMVKLRLVINFALKPHLIARVFPPTKDLFSSFIYLEKEVICCHPNDPDIVYLMYGDKLVECDVGKGRLRVIHHCTHSWFERYMLVHPLMAP